jgi:UDP-N-acetylglucosamine diphosphorylase/glucosamine-1-phosphate N-acetyltransferase
MSASFSDFSLICFDEAEWAQFYPFSETRPIAEFRLGMLRIGEKWARGLDKSYSHLVRDELAALYPFKSKAQNLLVNGSVLPDAQLLEAVKGLHPGASLQKGSKLLACVVAQDDLDLVKQGNWQAAEQIEYEGEIRSIEHNWDLFRLNAEEIQSDFQIITSGRKSEAVSSSNTIIGDHPVFLEPGAKVEAAVLNTESGPIYVGEHAEIMEGSLLRGPVALMSHAVLKMGAKVYGGSTLGPFVKCGGELNNVLLFGYSNKAHDGFLGNSVIGEWCNLGADSNNSNLKNNYGPVRVWNQEVQDYVDSGLQFCGLFMGDHSKCGINTMFNTGTVVGVSSNVFGSGFPDKHIPSFSWGGAEGIDSYRLDKALEVAEAVMNRRGKSLGPEERAILEHIHRRRMH